MPFNKFAGGWVEALSSTLREISGFTNQSFFVKIVFTKNVKVVMTIMVVAVILWKNVYFNCKERYWDHDSGKPSGRSFMHFV